MDSTWTESYTSICLKLVFNSPDVSIHLIVGRTLGRKVIN